MNEQLKEYSKELKDELKSILDYWMQHTIDKEYGGFYTFIDRKGNVKNGGPIDRAR